MELELNRLKQLSIFTFILGLIFLFYLNKTLPILSVSEAENYIGNTVLVEGKLIGMGKTSSGNLKRMICDNKQCYWIVFHFNLSQIEDCSYILTKAQISEYYGEIYFHVWKRSWIKLCK